MPQTIGELLRHKHKCEHCEAEFACDAIRPNCPFTYYCPKCEAILDEVWAARDAEMNYQDTDEEEK